MAVNPLFSPPLILPFGGLFPVGIQRVSRSGLEWPNRVVTPTGRAVLISSLKAWAGAAKCRCAGQSILSEHGGAGPRIEGEEFYSGQNATAPPGISQCRAYSMASIEIRNRDHAFSGCASAPMPEPAIRRGEAETAAATKPAGPAQNHEETSA